MSTGSRPAPVIALVAGVLAVAVLLALGRLWWPLAAYVVVVAPILHLTLYPERPCRRCEGGRTWSPGRRAFARDCRVCDGGGSIARWGGLGYSLRSLFGIQPRG